MGFVVKTTWGDCPNPECPLYGQMQYSIEPGDRCQHCGKVIRWWDRWHDGAHQIEQVVECLAERT